MIYSIYMALNSLATTVCILYLIPNKRNDQNFYLWIIGIMLFFICFHSLNYRFELPERLLRGCVLGAVVILVGLVTSKARSLIGSKFDRG